MAKVSKVQKSNGDVIMDISQDTVNANNLLQGATAHGSDGEAVQGAVIVAPTDVTEVSDTTPYIYKTSEHDAVYDELVGGSVAWNQLVANSGSSLSVTITSGHKYVMKKSGTLSVGASSGSAITGLTGGTDWITDLTQMFGSTIADYVYNLEQSTAGSGIAWLKSYGFFTKDYYAYNVGALTSVNVSGKRVVGKNLLEITASSQTQNGVTFIVNKDNETITVSGTPSALTQLLIGKLENKGGFILSGCASGGSTTSYDIRTDNGIDAGSSAIDFGNGANFSNNNQQGETWIYLTVRANYTFDNLVFKPMIRRADVTDPTFEPYTSITYPIQSTDLRGLYKLNGSELYTDGDIYSADGQITRKYGIVDLGTLNWNANGSYGEGQYEYAAVISGKANGVINMICSTMTVQSTASLNCIRGRASSSTVSVVSSETTKEAFKTAMSGVYLIYELATPTTETAQPFASPQMVYHSGTEEYLDTRNVPMPVGGNRKYVDIPEWMVNEYFDDVRAEASMALPTTGGTINGDLDVTGLVDVHNAYVRDDLTVGENLTVYQDLTVNPDFSINCRHISRTAAGRAAEITLETLPAIDFYVSDSGVNSQLHFSTGYFGINDATMIYPDAPSGTGTSLALDSSYNIVKVTSSRDTKHDISYVEDTNGYHDALMQLKPATFIYNSDKTETQKLGMIAEDVADICPIAGMTDKDGKVENYDDRAIITMLVAEVQRLNAEIDKLKGR